MCGYRKEVFKLEDNPLAKARKKSLLTQEQLSKKIGVSTVTISSWENSPLKNGCLKISVADLKKYFDALDGDGQCFLKMYLDSIFLPV